MAPGVAENELKRAWGTAKAQVTMILNNLEKIFKLQGREAAERQKEAEDTWTWLERAQESLKKAHSDYSQAVLAETDADGVEDAVGELFDYIDAVDKRVYSILHQSKVFKARLGLAAVKETFRSALEDYSNFQVGNMIGQAEKARGAAILEFPIKSQTEQNTKYYLALKAACDALKNMCLEANEDSDTVLSSVSPGFNLSVISKDYNNLNAGAEKLLIAQAVSSNVQ